jgi:hypothetical protein
MQARRSVVEPPTGLPNRQRDRQRDLQRRASLTLRQIVMKKPSRSCKGAMVIPLVQ